MLSPRFMWTNMCVSRCEPDECNDVLRILIYFRLFAGTSLRKLGHYSFVWLTIVGMTIMRLSVPSFTLNGKTIDDDIYQHQTITGPNIEENREEEYVSLYIFTTLSDIRVIFYQSYKSWIHTYLFPLHSPLQCTTFNYIQETQPRTAHCFFAHVYILIQYIRNRLIGSFDNKCLIQLTRSVITSFLPTQSHVSRCKQAVAWWHLLCFVY